MSSHGDNYLLQEKGMGMRTDCCEGRTEVGSTNTININAGHNVILLPERLVKLAPRRG